jgi:phospholipid/cholesterol/gamma-HCH transport system substrate-binding protein
METKPESGIASTLIPRNLGVKVGMLIAATVLIAGGFVLYVLFARGVFEQTQRIYLIADNAEGVRVGMNLTFAGFPIGTVRRITLRDDGKVRISVRVPVTEAKWLRQTSVFVLDIPLVGAAKLRVYSSNLSDPLLEDRAERPVLRGDANEEIPRMIATLRQVLENIDQITDSGSSLQESLKNVRTLTERMAGKQGVLGAALGGEENARQLMKTIDQANALLASLDKFVAKTDQRLYATGGIADDLQKAVAHANEILGEVRASLKRVDGILADAQVVAGNAKAASTDLAALRAEVEASLRKVAALIDEINRKWPFERDTKIKLP